MFRTLVVDTQVDGNSVTQTPVLFSSDLHPKDHGSHTRTPAPWLIFVDATFCENKAQVKTKAPVNENADQNRRMMMKPLRRHSAAPEAAETNRDQLR